MHCSNARARKVGLLTTEGHRDILEMREGLKHDRYNLRMPPPVPLVRGICGSAFASAWMRRAPFAWRSTMPRLRSRSPGSGDAGVDAVAICFLHGYRNPSHERIAADAVRAALPGVFVSASHDVYPQIKEFERTSTTIINAYVGPKLSTYLQSLEARLKTEGLAGPLYIMLSHGGVASVAEAARLAGATLLSGPAGGVAAAHRAAADLGPATSSPSTWAAHRPTSRSSVTASDRCRPSGPSPVTRSRFRAWTSSRSVPAADRSRAWTQPASCGSVRKRRG